MSSLNPRFVLGSLDLTDYPFATAFGSSLGNPEQAVDILASLLADGEIESRSRRSNRTLTIPLLIEGSDLAQLAQAEADLIAECDKQRNTLTVDPGDGYGPPTVFDTFSALAEREYDDNAEQCGYRRWNLTIRALPYGRSVNKIVDDAGTPPSEAGMLLYNCESTTGWSKWDTFPGAGGGNIGTAITVDNTVYTEGAGSIRATSEYSYNGGGTGPWSFKSSDKVTGLSLSTGDGGYLSVSIKVAFDTPVAPSAFGLFELWQTTSAGEVKVATFSAAKVRPDGFVDYVWQVDAGLTITGLRFHVGSGYLGAIEAPGKAYVWYDNVQLLPAATTDHQITKTLTVKGSARTTASLRVSAPSASVALGQVLAITAPSSELRPGFQPDGRRWVAQGTTTTDATALHGSYFSPAASYSSSTGYPIFDVPVNMLTAGPYTIVALVKAESSSATFGVQSRLRIDTTDVGPTSTAEVSPTGLTVGWQFITIGTVDLPPVPMQGAGDTAKVRLLFRGSKFADVYFIPAWRVGGRPVADFSIVDCGTSTVGPGLASSSLWIDSPAVENDGLGAWWRGPTTDRLNVQSAWPDAKKPGVHAFSPGALTAFLVSTGAAGPTLALEYYPAWLGSAAI